MSGTFGLVLNMIIYEIRIIFLFCLYLHVITVNPTLCIKYSLPNSAMLPHIYKLPHLCISRDSKKQ